MRQKTLLLIPFLLLACQLFQPAPPDVSPTEALPAVLPGTPPTATAPPSRKPAIGPWFFSFLGASTI
ncbi:MAG: hypothetical protein ACE5GO_11535, partial [Anaerolineales bacterium]